MCDTLVSDKQGFSGNASLWSHMHCYPWGDYYNSLEFLFSLSGTTQIKGFASFTVPDCRVALCFAFQSVSVEVMVTTSFVSRYPCFTLGTLI